MLVVLPYGTCVDPEGVKLITIRQEKVQQGSQTLSVWAITLKSEADENWQLIDRTATREEAEEVAVECAKRINLALGEKTVMTSEDAGGDDDAESSDDDDDDDW